jgi:TorA maturation chaperone TorD
MQSAAIARAAIMSEEERGGVPDDQVRGHTYSLLGALLAAAPGAELLELLASVDPAPGVDADFAAAWRELAIAAARAEPRELADEYQDLFIGLGRGEVVPYGSWYMTGFLMDRPLAVLRGDLAELGFERQSDVREPEDHAAALCETMAMLVSEGHDLDAQRRFFQQHLGPWMATFFKDLREAKSAQFYRAVGQFGEQFTEFESRYLSMVV